MKPIVTTLAATLCLIALTAASAQDRLTQASIVFRGTVLRLQDTTMQLVAAGPQTIVVRVDEMLPPSDSNSDYKGKEVTLRVKDPSKFKVGDKAIFYTKGWLLADSIALVEVDHTKIPLGGALSTATLTSILQDGQAVEKNLLQDRSGRADILIEGIVVSTEPVEERPLGGAAERPRPISEHSPQLRKATIEVVGFDTTKGNTNVPKVVTVLYPASEDVRWQGAPRFERGDRGVFILSKAEKSIELKDFVRDLKFRVDDMDKYFFGPSQLDFQPNINLKNFKELLKPIVTPGP